jgi:hypothetical protein
MLHMIVHKIKCFTQKVNLLFNACGIMKSSRAPIAPFADSEKGSSRLLSRRPNINIKMLRTLVKKFYTNSKIKLIKRKSKSGIRFLVFFRYNPLKTKFFLIIRRVDGPCFFLFCPLPIFNII